MLMRRNCTHRMELIVIIALSCQLHMCVCVWNIVFYYSENMNHSIFPCILNSIPDSSSFYIYDHWVMNAWCQLKTLKVVNQILLSLYYSTIRHTFTLPLHMDMICLLALVYHYISTKQISVYFEC